MDEPKNRTQEQSSKALDQELEDLDVGADAAKVTGGSSDPCEGGQFAKK